MLKKFWQNLGLNYEEIRTLPKVTIDMLSSIMSIEEQFEERGTKEVYRQKTNKKRVNKK